MKAAALLGLASSMEIDQLQITETGLIVEVASTCPQSCCPVCSQPSSHVHSYYHRTLKDAPCVGRQLQLELFVRKFYCRNPDCSRKVFTERLKPLAESWARMTTRRLTRSSCRRSHGRAAHGPARDRTAPRRRGA